MPLGSGRVIVLACVSRCCCNVCTLPVPCTCNRAAPWCTSDRGRNSAATRCAGGQPRERHLQRPGQARSCGGTLRMNVKHAACACNCRAARARFTSASLGTPLGTPPPRSSRPAGAHDAAHGHGQPDVGAGRAQVVGRSGGCTAGSGRVRACAGSLAHACRGHTVGSRAGRHCARVQPPPPRRVPPATAAVATGCSRALGAGGRSSR